jgi:hypothetical protein
MSTFRYNDPVRLDPLLGVKCDMCGSRIYTQRSGQEFPFHITVDARSAGWEHKKENSNWRDYCQKCVEAIQNKERERALEVM